jgi:3-hydroxybutyryl-CoA dehydratase
VVTVTEKREDKKILKLQTTVSNQRGEVVVDGSAVMMKLGL